MSPIRQILNKMVPEAWPPGSVASAGLAPPPLFDPAIRVHSSGGSLAPPSICVCWPGPPPLLLGPNKGGCELM